MAANPTTGTPEAMTAHVVTAPAKMAANPTTGTPAPAQGALRAAAVPMVARMTIWREPTREGTNLYIPQVYAAEPDGTNLKIY